jgi:hypothetical protein
MAKRITREEEVLTVEAAVAVHMVLLAPRVTARQCTRQLLESVRGLTKNPTLTLQNMKTALRLWFEKGWATISKNAFCIMRAGRAKIHEIADRATSPVPAPA